MDSTKEIALKVSEKETSKESPSESKSSQADPAHVDVSLVIQKQTAKDKDQKIPSYEIESQFKNAKENPHTMTLPRLVRKVPESDLTPRPWTKFIQILCLSYISVLFFPLLGVFANRYAWKANRANEKGLYDLAKKWAKLAVILSYVAFGLGCITITIIVLGVKDML